VLHCCKAHAKINRKMGNSTPCKIVTPKNYILKPCTRNYVGEVIRHANFFSSIGRVGASSQIGEILPPCDFFMTVFTFFLDPTLRSNRWNDFHALWLKRRVSSQEWSFWWLKRWVTIFGGILPQNGCE